jgi:hypothetical protein
MSSTAYPGRFRQSRAKSAIWAQPLKAHLGDGYRGSHLKPDSFLPLKIGNDLKEITGGGIPFWPKHLMQGLDVQLGMGCQLWEANGRIDVIPQQLFPKRHFTGEKGLHGVAKKALPERGIASYTCLHCFPKIAR